MTSSCNCRSCQEILLPSGLIKGVVTIFTSQQVQGTCTCGCKRGSLRLAHASTCECKRGLTQAQARPCMYMRISMYIHVHTVLHHAVTQCHSATICPVRGMYIIIVHRTLYMYTEHVHV